VRFLLSSVNHALDKAYSIAFPGGFFSFSVFSLFSCTNVARVLSFYYICSEIADRFEHFVDEI